MVLSSVEIAEGFVIESHELDWQFSTSGGPGGQHANRSQTRAEIRWSIVASQAGTVEQRQRLIRLFGELIIIRVDRHRSQKRNRDEALIKLSTKIREGLNVQTSRKKTGPSRSAKRKRTDAKTRRGDLKRQRRRPSAED